MYEVTYIANYFHGPLRGYSQRVRLTYTTLTAARAGKREMQVYADFGRALLCGKSSYRVTGLELAKVGNAKLLNKLSPRKLREAGAL